MDETGPKASIHLSLICSRNLVLIIECMLMHFLFKVWKH